MHAFGIADGAKEASTEDAFFSQSVQRTGAIVRRSKTEYKVINELKKGIDGRESRSVRSCVCVCVMLRSLCVHNSIDQLSHAAHSTYVTQGIRTFMTTDSKGVRTVLKQYDMSVAGVLQLLDNEVSVRKRLTGHPSIDAVESVFIDGQNAFATMRATDSGSLVDWLETNPSEYERVRVFKLVGRPLSSSYPTRTLFLTELTLCTEQIMQSLEWIHNHGVVHGNLKPTNILMHKPNGLFVYVISSIPLSVCMVMCHHVRVCCAANLF